MGMRIEQDREQKTLGLVPGIQQAANKQTHLLIISDVSSA